MGFAEAQAIEVSTAEIQEDTQWLAGLGIKVPNDGYILKKPFEGPLTRRSFIVPASWYSLPLKKEVKASDLLKDLPFIKTAYRHTYSGYEVAAKRGWNWDQWFTDWEAQLSSKGDQVISVEEAFAPITKLKLFQPDNHMGPVVDSPTAYARVISRSALLTNIPTDSCSEIINDKNQSFQLQKNQPAHQPKLAKLPDNTLTYYVTYPSLYGVVTQIRCGEELIRLKPFWQNEALAAVKQNKVLKLAQTEKDKASFRWAASDILYVRFPGMNYDHRQSYLELEQEIKTADLSKAKVIILDHRGSGGGYGFAFPTYEYLTAGNFMNSKDPRGFIKQSCLSYGGSGIWGQIQWMLKRSNQVDPLPVEDVNEYQGILDGLFTEEPGCPITFPPRSTSPTWKYVDRKFEPTKSKPILMFLTDNDCGSTCEGSQFAFAQLPNTIIVGTNSYGVAQFTGGNFFVTPNTKITYRFSSGVSDMYGDNRPFDGYGLNADMILPDEEMQDPEYILNLARSLTK